MTRTEHDPFAAGHGRRERIDWASEDAHVAALNVLHARVADPGQRRELALMLGYGEPEIRARYENGLRARQSLLDPLAGLVTPVGTVASVSGSSGRAGGVLALDGGAA